MSRCALCGRTGVQEAHVRDRKCFDNSDRRHDFFNIIKMCPFCHYELFDKGKVAILPEDRLFLILRSIEPLDIEEVQTFEPLSIKPEYIQCKNGKSHTCLQAAIRRRRKKALSEEEHIYSS